MSVNFIIVPADYQEHMAQRECLFFFLNFLSLSLGSGNSHETKGNLKNVALESEIDEPVPDSLRFTVASAEEGVGFAGTLLISEESWPSDAWET